MNRPTSSDTIERDISMSFDFLRAIIDDPSIADDIPDHAAIVLLTDDNPELAEVNLQNGIRAARDGADVYIRHFLRTKPVP